MFLNIYILNGQFKEIFFYSYQIKWTKHLKNKEAIAKENIEKKY